MNVNSSSIVTIFTVSAAGVRCLFFQKEILMGMVLGKCGIRWRADWRAMVKAGMGTGGGMRWWIETDVELRAFKGVRSVQLYSPKMYSLPTVYVYSKRLT